MGKINKTVKNLTCRVLERPSLVNLIAIWMISVNFMARMIIRTAL